MATQKQRAAAPKEHQESRRSGKTKTNFETLTKENASSARAASRES